MHLLNDLDLYFTERCNNLRKKCFCPTTHHLLDYLIFMIIYSTCAMPISLCMCQLHPAPGDKKSVKAVYFMRMTFRLTNNWAEATVFLAPVLTHIHLQKSRRKSTAPYWLCKASEDSSDFKEHLIAYRQRELRATMPDILQLGEKKKGGRTLISSFYLWYDILLQKIIYIPTH